MADWISIQVTESDQRRAVGPVGTPINSAAAWAQLSDWLPEMLAELLASEVYGIDRRPPKDQRGVYLFTERGNNARTREALRE
jgi:hypothetical protein